MSGNGTMLRDSRVEITLIRINGYLDMITAEQLDKSISALISANRINIIVDLQNVEYISSSGWGVFLGNIKDIRERGGDLKLAQMSPEVFEVYKVLEFFWFIKSYDEISDAVSEFDMHVQPMLGMN